MSKLMPLLLRCCLLRWRLLDAIALGTVTFTVALFFIVVAIMRMKSPIPANHSRMLLWFVVIAGIILGKCWTARRLAQIVPKYT